MSRSRTAIAILALVASLALPAAASAATGSISIQSSNGDQVTGSVSIVSTDDDSYYGQSYWFAYVLQVNAAQACNTIEGDVAMLSTRKTDGTIPRDLDGHFNAPGTYNTTFTLVPSYSPQIRVCVYASTLGNKQQLVAETVVNTPATTRFRIGAICNDGWHSAATGSGACASHGGVRSWIYNIPPTPVTTPPTTPAPPAEGAPVTRSCHGIVRLKHGDTASRISTTNVRCAIAKRAVKRPATNLGYKCKRTKKHGSGGWMRCTKGSKIIRFLYSQS
jgi:hypothetical protein